MRGMRFDQNFVYVIRLIDMNLYHVQSSPWLELIGYIQSILIQWIVKFASSAGEETLPPLNQASPIAQTGQ